MAQINSPFNAENYPQINTTWPQTDAQGRLVWACCVSSIGPDCEHVSGRVNGYSNWETFTIALTFANERCVYDWAMEWMRRNGPRQTHSAVPHNLRAHVTEVMSNGRSYGWHPQMNSAQAEAFMRMTASDEPFNWDAVKWPEVAHDVIAMHTDIVLNGGQS